MSKTLKSMDFEAGSDGGIFALRGNLDGELVKDFVERTQYIGLMIGSEEFLAPIASVDEIIMLTPITYVPKGPKFVDGVINLRGQIVPAVNLRKMMGLPRGEPQASSRVVIVRELGLRVGLVVDAITYVVSLLPGQVENQKLSSKGLGAELIAAISKHDNKVTGILDLPMVIHMAAGGKLADEEEAESSEDHAA